MKHRIAIAMAAGILALPSVSQAFDLPTQEQLAQMCNEQGGIGLHFGQTELPEKAQDEQPFPLGESLGQFSTVEVWTAPQSGELMVLRYETETDGDQSDAINNVFVPHLQALGWTLVPDDYQRPLYSQAPLPMWMKNVSIDEKETEVLLQIEGGIESTSLYCGRADLMPRTWAEAINGRSD